MQIYVICVVLLLIGCKL